VSDFQSEYQKWADVHSRFDNLHDEPSLNEDRLKNLTERWSHRLLQAPNGELWTHNSMFKSLMSEKKLYLLHVTHALEEIREHGMIYPSGGCLVGSIYCTPLTRCSDGFRMHNLGEYILTKEAPAFVKRSGVQTSKPTPLIIEIDIPDNGNRGLSGIDYLRLGNVHLGIYQGLKYLLSTDERSKLEESVVLGIRNAYPFLNMCSALLHGNATKEDPEKFILRLNEAIFQIPILGYLYFEALAEYLMLYSKTERTLQLRINGELNNLLYKEMLCSIFPAGKFDLSQFQLLPKNMGILEKIDPTIDAQHIMPHLMDRVTYLVGSRLFSTALRPQSLHTTHWEFDHLCNIGLAPMIGHLIHRQLRSFGRYPDFYFYFDQLKALGAWNYWNHMGIVAPFNGTIPKGEIGVNPAYPSLKYKIYHAEMNERGILYSTGKMNLTIAKKLVDIKYTLMRNKIWKAPKLRKDRVQRQERVVSSSGEQSLERIFTWRFRTNYWGSEETRSGRGSELRQTNEVRNAVLKILDHYKIQSVIDAGCGDLNWQKRVSGLLNSTNYIGIDVVEELISLNRNSYGHMGARFVHADITSDKIPTADLVICRDCLVHLPNRQIINALRQISASNSKYLLTTTYPSERVNDDSSDGRWRPLNLSAHPFGLPDPIEFFNTDFLDNGRNHPGNGLGLWLVSSLPVLEA
jgi:SAM-dependent methyltransferase